MEHFAQVDSCLNGIARPEMDWQVTVLVAEHGNEPEACAEGRRGANCRPWQAFLVTELGERPPPRSSPPTPPSRGIDPPVIGDPGGR